MNLSIMIISHNGRYFRFSRRTGETGPQLECQVCYWKGVVDAPAPDGTFQARVSQKYTPHATIEAEAPFTTEKAAIAWVAATLARQEAAEGQ